MKQYIGMLVKLHIKIDGKNLFFTAKINDSSTDTHTSFTDKYGNPFTYHDDLVKQVKLIS